MTLSSAAPRGLPRWRVAVFLIFGGNGIAMATWIARMPAVRDQLALSTAQVGLLVFAVAIGAIVGVTAAGHLVAWRGDRAIVVAALSTCGVALAGVGIGAFLVDSAVTTAIFFALLGFSNGVTDIAMNLSGAGVERTSGKAIMPWFHAAWSAGTVVGAFLGSAAASAAISPAVHLPVVGAAVIVVVILAGRWLPSDSTASDDSEEPRPGLAERMAVWRKPRTLLLGLIVLGMGFTEGSANDWLALAFVDGHGVDNAAGAFAFGLFATAMTAGRLLGVPLLNRFGRVPVLRGAAATAAVGLAVVILSPAAELAFAGVVLWGLGASLGFPVGISAAADDPRTAAATVSAVATIGYLSFLVGPPLIGFVGEHVGLLTALWIVLGLIVLALLAIPAAKPPAVVRAAPDADRAAGDTNHAAPERS